MGEQLMAWGKAGSTTLTSSGTDMSVTSMTNSKTGMALGLHSSGGTAIKLNGENGSNGSGNYAVRRSTNGGTDSTNTQRNGDNAYITDVRANPHFNVTYFVNISSEEKLWINNNVHQNSAGAGNAPAREEGAGKWANTSDVISQFDYHCWNGTYASGDNITVLGSDITPAPTTPAVPAIPSLMPVVGGWKEVARHTLGSNTNPILASSIPDKRYYMVLYHTKHSSGSWNQPRIRFGNGSTDAGGNYAQRYSQDFGQVTNSLGQNTYFLGWAGQGNEPNQPLFGMFYVANKSDKEKVVIHNATDIDATGTSDAPRATQQVAKWINTSNVLDRIELNSASGSSNFTSGDEVVVLGWDPDDTHTDNFWEELANVTTGSAGALSSGTFTAKKYLWVQAYTPSSSNASPDGYIEFNGDSATNYCHRRSHNGGSQTVGTGDGIGIRIDGTGGQTAKFHNFFIKNIEDDEKLVISNSTTGNTGAEGTAPSRTDCVGKWVNTSDQITRIDIIDQYASPNWGAGSIIKVWGHN